MSTSVKVLRLPNCDLCPPTIKAAHYDGATSMGPWAYMCDEHFQQYGVGLGTGRGQRLITEDREETE